MSERGSFVTEYIYCSKCFDAAKTVLLGREKYLCCSMTVPTWEGVSRSRNELPIIAGKIGGLYGGEELFTFRHELIPELEEIICHPIRIAVLAEHGEAILTALPVVK